MADEQRALFETFIVAESKTHAERPTSVGFSFAYPITTLIEPFIDILLFYNGQLVRVCAYIREINYSMKHVGYIIYLSRPYAQIIQ